MNDDVSILNDRELDALYNSPDDDVDMAAVRCVVRELRSLRSLRSCPAEPQGLTAEEREALKWLVKHVNATTMPGVRPRRDKERAIAVLDRLLAAEVRR